MNSSPEPVLITGATGRQGGATARALLAAEVPVRALVRHPSSPAAQEVEALGAELVAGNLLDRDSLLRAMRGVRGVFSVQMPAVYGAGFDFQNELDQALTLIDAARATDVPHFVQTTASGVSRFTDWPGHETGRWDALAPYFTTKNTIENRVREAGFQQWTILRPGTFMENFLPEAAYLLPRGLEGGIVTVLKPHTHLSLVAVPDIGAVAAAAFTDPDRFDRMELELASDYLPMSEIARALSAALGVELQAPDLTDAQALAAGMPAWALESHEMLREIGQPARPEFLRALGIRPTSFTQWLQPWALAS
ncbi:NmrA/HSCARG family protein [Kineosporia babensis]|uniref:NmrA/HSCARG family protein n=1 Tax=Kineosporia babensis TaxID=499548 RepID=A0A9X1ST09_9ACTN|nr:NmrA/HSCARG family protein [Kineosporia babensis]MCD5311274.1 NmrA/HSCARG family protein [Kineosporia babensis]